MNRELFLSLEEARWVIDRWRLDYNHHRIHSALNYRTPAALCSRLCSSGFGYASASRTQPDSLTPILSLMLEQTLGGGHVRRSLQRPTGLARLFLRFSFGQNLQHISLTTLPLHPAEAGSKFENEEMGCEVTVKSNWWYTA